MFLGLPDQAKIERKNKTNKQKIFEIFFLLAILKVTGENSTDPQRCGRQ
jgi:hypothetical protein